MGRLVALILVVGLVGCAGEDEPLLAESDLPRLVLQPADLTQTWTRFDEGPQLRADAPFGERADATRFGRQGGWKARYRRPGSAATTGPLVVESRADLFADASGAERDFDIAVDDLQGSVGASQPLDVIELGDEARLLETGSGEPGQIATVTVVWRDRNVVAALTANGFTGKLKREDGVALAREQQRRMELARG